MATGSVKFYNDARGFGFILVDGDQTEMFFHIQNCDDAIELLEKGQRVQFESGVNDRTGKPEAKNVILLNEKSVARA